MKLGIFEWDKSLTMVENHLSDALFTNKQFWKAIFADS